MSTCQIDCKKLGLTTVVVFVVNAVLNYLIHEVYLKAAYEASAALWRSPEDMKNFILYMMAGQFIYALFFTWIFAHGYKGTGWKEGVRYGLLMGGTCLGGNLIMYAVAPYPMDLVIQWTITGFIQSAIIGVVASLIYKPKAA